MESSYLKDYLYYHSGNECPRNWHIWSALVAASVAVSRKVYLSQEYFSYYPNLYVCLVGEQGTRKNVARQGVKDLLLSLFPDLSIGFSVDGREAICRDLSSPERIRTFKDSDGIIQEYRPMVFLINELKNFLSVNPTGMIDFLTDIYDEKTYDVRTKNKGIDRIPNPYLVILACETPRWIISRLKEDVITGGFSRRFAMVYETDESEPIAFPHIPPGGMECLERIKQTLKRVSTLVGPMSWDEQARKFFEDWYCKTRRVIHPDAFMRGWYRSKHVQLLKIATLLSITESSELVLKAHHLEIGVAILDSIEPNMAKLSLSTGRNESAGPTQQVLSLIRQAGGIITEKNLRMVMFREMKDERENYRVLKYLQDTEQIKIVDEERNGVKRRLITLREYAEELLKKEPEPKKD